MIDKETVMTDLIKGIDCVLIKYMLLLILPAINGVAIN